MQAVRKALLALPILPADLKKALEGIDDWTRTLPVPDLGGQAEEINLDGASGFFVRGRVPPQPHGEIRRGPLEETYYGPSLLAWYREGVWTVLEGSSATMTKEELVDLARQLEAAYGR